MIEQKLDQLAELNAQKQLLALDKMALKDKILTDDMRVELAAVDAEFEDQENEVNKKINELTEGIKAAVVNHGSKVIGTHLPAIYIKGRKSWNTNRRGRRKSRTHFFA